MATMPRVPARRPALPILALLAGLSPAMPAVTAASAPGQVTIYRCVGADGQLTLRDTPCAAGEHQEARGMLRPQDPPPQPPAAAPALPASSPVGPAPPRVVVVHAPTPTYECTTPDGDRYTSHNPAGNPRWVPLWTLGYPAWTSPRRPHQRPMPPVRPAAAGTSYGSGLVYDGVGRPTPSAPADHSRLPALPPHVGLAATPGTWIRDECRPLPQAEVCERLRDRHWELGRRYNSALQGERHAIDAEQRRIDAQLAAECPP